MSINSLIVRFPICEELNNFRISPEVAKEVLIQSKKGDDLSIIPCFGREERTLAIDSYCRIGKIPNQNKYLIVMDDGWHIEWWKHWQKRLACILADYVESKLNPSS